MSLVARSLAVLVMLLGVAAVRPPSSTLPLFQGVPGLLGEYYNGAAPAAAPADPTGTVSVTYTDGPVAFTNRGATDPWAVPWKAGIGPNNFMARWTGYVRGPITGPVDFKVGGDDHTALYLNGTLQPNYYWAGRAYPATPEVNTINMVQDEWIPIKLLFAQGGGDYVVRLFWSYAGQTDINIPTTHLNQNPPPPPVPTLSISTPPSFSPVINLSWTASTGAISYNILRGFSSGTETQYATVTAPTTTYSDTGVVFGQSYFYVVRAVNGPSASGNSNEVSGMPQPVPPRTGNNHRSDCGCASTGLPGWATLAAGLAALGLLLATARKP
jgi:hypothetical protein